MSEQKNPEAISEGDLDAVQGAGSKLERGNGIVLSSESEEPTKSIVMHEEMETVFMDRKSPGKGVILSSESQEPTLKKG